MEYIKLKDLTNTITCGVAKRPEYVDKGIKFLSSQNVKSDKINLNKYNNISYEDYKKLTKINKPEKGDILYTRVGSLGEAAVIDFDEEFAIYVSLTLIKPKHELINNRYLMHYLNSPKVKDFANNNTRGIGVQNLNVDTVREYDIPLPSFEEQKKIVEVLDKAQSLIDKKKEQIELLDELVKSRFVDMFVNFDSNIYKFEKVKMNEVCLKITDGTHKTPEYINEGIKFISAKDIKTGKMDLTNTKYISNEEYELIQKRCQLKKGDILLSKSGSIGTPVILDTDEPLGIFESLAVLKIKEDLINNKYFCEFLKSDSVQRKILFGTKGVAIKHLHLNVLKDLDVVLPPIELQNEFAEFVTQTDSIRSKMETSLSELEDNFNSLMQRAFKGELF